MRYELFEEDGTLCAKFSTSTLAPFGGPVIGPYPPPSGHSFGGVGAQCGMLIGLQTSYPDFDLLVQTHPRHTSLLLRETI